MIHNASEHSTKMTDFGSGCIIPDCDMGSAMCTIFWRAPESFLGLPYSTPSDMWSFGIIVAQLQLKGRFIFPGNNDTDILCHMVEVLGMPPPSMADPQKARRYKSLFGKFIAEYYY